MYTVRDQFLGIHRSGSTYGHHLTNNDWPMSTILHSNQQCHWPFGHGEKHFKGFHHIWTWQVSWSCDPHTPYSFSFPKPTDVP